jgi:glycosyltransferase involved in cell wall biosynthesis
MSRPVRVLSLYEGFFAGGARVLHSDVIAGLHARGDQEHRALSLASEVVREASVQPLRDDPRYRRLTRAGVEVSALDRAGTTAVPGPGDFSDWNLHVAAHAIAQADVVLALKEQPLGLLMALDERGLLPDVPVAVALHRSDPGHSGAALDWLRAATASGLVQGLVACAHSTRAAYAAAGVSAPMEWVVPNGIDLERFSPAAATDPGLRASLGIDEDAPVVVFAARFDAMKDPGLFLRSAEELARDDARTRFVMCGAGMTLDNPALRELVADFAPTAAGRIHALGIRDDMPALYRMADIVALTSAFGEASPLCLIEGAASGATPVSTDVGDAARVIEGFGVVTARDERDIARAWREVLSSRPVWRERALNARTALGRERMVTEYGQVVDLLARPAEAAA